MSSNHNPTERPYTPYSSTERDDMQDEIRVEQQRRPRTCLECGCTGGHNAGCPADDETEQENDE